MVVEVEGVEEGATCRMEGCVCVHWGHKGT